MSLLGIFARNVHCIDNNGCELLLSKQTTILTGPSGSGKTSTFRIVQTVLKVLQGIQGKEEETVYTKCFLDAQTLGTRVSGGKSGSATHHELSAGLLWMDSKDDVYIVGIIKQKKSNSLQVKYIKVHDNKAGDFKAIQLKMLKRLTEEISNTILDNTSNEPLRRDILTGILILPQDHGVLQGFHANHTFLCNQATLFDGTALISASVSRLMKTICDVTVSSPLSLDQKCLERLEGGDKYSVNDCSGGQRDCLFSLCAVFGVQSKAINEQARVVLLDEPGQNLGAFQRQQLRDAFGTDESMKKQLVIITHHVEMLDRELLPANILRVSINSTLKGGRFGMSRQANLAHVSGAGGTDDTDGANVLQQHTIKAEQDRFWKHNGRRLWAQVDNLSAFFAAGFIILEGMSDLQVLDCLDTVLTTIPKISNLLFPELEYRGFRWKLVVGEGNDVEARVKLAQALKIPYIYVYDFDKIAKKLDFRDAFYGKSGMDHDSHENNKIGIWTMSRLGGHASAAFDRTKWTSSPPYGMESGADYFRRALNNWAFRMAINYIIKTDEGSKDELEKLYQNQSVHAAAEYVFNVKSDASSSTKTSEDGNTKLGDLRLLGIFKTIFTTLTGKSEDILYTEGSDENKLLLVLQAFQSIYQQCQNDFKNFDSLLKDVKESNWDLKKHWRFFRVALYGWCNNSNENVNKIPFARVVCVAASLTLKNKYGPALLTFDGAFCSDVLNMVAPFACFAQSEVALGQAFFWPPSVSDIEGLLVDKYDDPRGRSRLRAHPAKYFDVNWNDVVKGGKKLQEKDQVDVNGLIEVLKLPQACLVGQGVAALAGSSRVSVAMAAETVKNILKLPSIQRPLLRSLLIHRLTHSESTRWAVKLLFTRLSHLGAINLMKKE